MAIFIIDLVGDDEDVVVLDEELKKPHEPTQVYVPTPQLEIVPFDRENVRKPRRRATRTN
jgi:hypothetical protein